MKWLLAAAFCSVSSVALAQGCGSTNPNCIVPTRPFGDSTNAAASTAFVQQNIPRPRLTVSSLYVDNVLGAPGNDCQSLATACPSIQACVNLINTVDLVNRQPICNVVPNAGYNESVQVIGPPTGGFAFSIGGFGGSFSWHPAPGGSFALEVEDGAAVVVQNASLDCVGGAGVCSNVLAHGDAAVVVEFHAGVTLGAPGANPGSHWIHADNKTLVNILNGITYTGGTGIQDFLNLGTQSRTNINGTLAGAGANGHNFVTLLQGTQGVIQGNVTHTGGPAFVNGAYIGAGSSLNNFAGPIPGVNVIAPLGGAYCTTTAPVC